MELNCACFVSAKDRREHSVFCVSGRPCISSHHSASPRVSTFVVPSRKRDLPGLYAVNLEYCSKIARVQPDPRLLLPRSLSLVNYAVSGILARSLSSHSRVVFHIWHRCIHVTLQLFLPCSNAVTKSKIALTSYDQCLVLLTDPRNRRRTAGR